MTTKTTTPSTSLALTAAVVLAVSGAVVTGAATAFGSGQASGSGPASGVAPKGDRVMRDVARQVLGAGAPGYTARIDDGHRVSLTTAGVADRATGRKLTGHDQFEIGSNTKTFMSALTLQLVDDGKVDLDAPVSGYLPGTVPGGDAITVRMLLNHTSGLFSYTADEDFAKGLTTDPERVWTPRELLDVAFAHDPEFAPGQGWSYSNTNYTLIGMLLEKLTGERLPDLVRERIAAPLGLRNTYFADPAATNTGPGYAHGYSVSFAGTEPAYTDTATWPIGGWGGAAGAIVSDQRDLSRFFSGLLGGELFSAEQLRQMKTTVDLPGDFLYQGGYGLGIFRLDSACGTVWGHGGDTNGHHSTAVATGDGRRTAVSDTTAEPGDLETSDGAERFVEVAVAAQEVTVCEMLGEPVPGEVTDALHGTTATTSAATTGR
ncbi:beta-lactamase family protein [Kineosporia sp. J2-2]|uniref:Beta-lactamase family protein n=1 Tax=Kineosporia corallincola TaxID=2835133 RepID=A0ABS5TK38_9ACTN|nr:serine hydrolase domain-containing protein [Kineosporia corallincola]MBT0771457.1 beta-lactamase family protein [Kineosporia corallincola]